ncbi:MAG: non-homologous end-joining DNA ligase [Pseudomonadales bacterium]
MSDTLELQVGHRTVGISHPDKRLFRNPTVRKVDLARYYARIAPLMIPHTRDRPLTVQRFPDGIDRKGFFQKHAPQSTPSWIRTARLAKRDGQVDHVVAEDAATLVHLANLSMITPHVGLSRLDDIQHPDRLIFDLDPSRTDAGAFEDVRFAAFRIGEALDRLGITSFVQTTGSRGLHVVAPIRRSMPFDDVRDFAQTLAARLSSRYPDRLTIEHRRSKRRHRVFLDFLRNAYGQTAVVPYGVRALPGAPVATPLEWSELKRPALGPQSYSIRNVFRRLGQKACPWRSLTRRHCDLERAVARLAQR